MDRYPMGAAPGVMARDIAERGKVRGAIDLEHDVSSLKAGFCVGCCAAARVCRLTSMVGSFRTDWKPECGVL